MLEGLQIAARFAQYACILVLFGVAAFGLKSLGAAAHLPMRRLLGAGAGASLAAATVGLFVQSGEMSGTLADGVKPDMLWTIVSATHYGVAWIVRMLALTLALPVARLAVGWPRMGYGLTLLLAGIAAASLAWGGHGVEGEGLAGLLHLSADLLHIWAAGTWIGALVCFVPLARQAGSLHLPALAQALRAFAGQGSAIVAVLVLTGVVNTVFLVPMNSLPALRSSLWALVLSAKLILFAAMLILATANRFVLTPRLVRGLGEDAQNAEAVRRLTLSLMLETGAAFAVLALVAWLGTLHPPSHLVSG